jgi:hypothetical protein
MKKKKIFLLVTSTLAFFSLLAFILLMVFGGNSEKKMLNELEVLGLRYYTDIWFPNNTEGQENIEAFLTETFSTNGVKVNLEALHIVFRNEDPDIMTIFTNDGEECNKVGTFIYFFQEAPWGPTNVRIEGTLDCGFEE